eukprot:TRINITY_DN78_c0_g1_i3.p1 TRINITY_DN78_c0_g1~~TRINITY_DN78_c0_g1_i3.p1  ORF type:complete len:158 (-),score=17.13 TRINITY_DN78_c0_g1_i3:241-714(-)
MTEGTTTSINLPRVSGHEGGNVLTWATSFTNKQVTKSQLNEILDSLMSIDLENRVLPKYRYPSGGSLYPVQTYIYVKPKTVTDVSAGIYYYHPKEHMLYLLSQSQDLEKQLVSKEQQESSFIIFLIAQLKAMEPLYPTNAKDMCFLEVKKKKVQIRS